MQKRLQASAGGIAVTVQCTVTAMAQHIFYSTILTLRGGKWLNR